MAGSISFLDKGVLRNFIEYLAQRKLGEILLVTGHLSPSHLTYALEQQALTHKALGQILVENRFVTKQQLFQTLLRQRVTRTFATIMLFTLTLSANPDTARADYIADLGAKISVVSSVETARFSHLNTHPALFGSAEKRSGNMKAFTKWIGMFDRFERTMAQPSSQKIMASLKENLSHLKSSSILSMAEKVNDLMNQTKYIVDDKNWGKSDYWATPIEFLTRGGDCEDFSIAKYIGLRALGVPEDRMRIAIVHDNRKNIPHAILIVYAENGPVVLDNQIKTVTATENISHYRPIFSINREAWWLHTSGDTTVVASSN